MNDETAFLILRVRLSDWAQELRELQARVAVEMDAVHDSFYLTEMGAAEHEIHSAAEIFEQLSRAESERAVVNRQLRDSLYMLHEEQVNPKELINTKPENLREFKRCEDIGGAK